MEQQITKKQKIEKATAFFALILIFASCGVTGGYYLNVDPSGIPVAAPGPGPSPTPAPASVITFSPASGRAGTLMTVSGTNINLSNPASITVSGAPAFIMSASASSTLIYVLGSTSGTVQFTPVSGSPTVSSGTFTADAIVAVNTEQAGPLVGTGSVGASRQGQSVALSADGNTAIVGGLTDDSDAGAAWIYTRDASGTWTQQGTKLVGTGSVGVAQQGIGVGMSADGNTAIVGGHLDDSLVGAAWVYTRDASGTWSQQGAKLVGTGNVGSSQQGISVALSANGNTAIVGAVGDSSSVGAAWIFKRTSGVWSQQGPKLVGTGSVGSSQQGLSTALSANGDTAIVGAFNDGGGVGAAWVYTRDASGTWSQQGSKLVGTGSAGTSNQGMSVSLSADGSTALVGGHRDSADLGAVWVFDRDGSGVWTQNGSKLVGSGATGGSRQGRSVSLSADGRSALVGGSHDNSEAGAVWTFEKDNLGTWSQQGGKLVGSGAAGAARQGLSVNLSADGRTGIVGATENSGSVGAAWIFIIP